MAKRVLILMVVWAAVTATVGIKAQTTSNEWNGERSDERSATLKSRHAKSLTFNDLFGESSKFEAKTGVWSLGVAVRSDVHKHGTNAQMQVPALTLSYERSIGYNIGLGGRVGYNSWKVADTKCQVHYYALSARAAYHINIAERWDPYFGIAASLRGATMVDERLQETKLKPSVSSFIGARYYLGNRFAMFGEIGADMMGWFHLGLNLKI